MSWELMNTSEESCKCGKGKIISEFYMDDWNRTKDTTVLECEYCREQNKMQQAIKKE